MGIFLFSFLSLAAIFAFMFYHGERNDFSSDSSEKSYPTDKASEEISSAQAITDNDTYTSKDDDENKVNNEEIFISNNMDDIQDEMNNSRLKIGLDTAAISALRSENSSLYYYSRLSGSEQVLYAELLYILKGVESNIYISASDTVMLDKVQNCVLNDHPEIFYVSGYYTTKYFVGEKTLGCSFSGQYIYDKAEIERRNILIEKYISRCLSALPETNDDYPKIKYIYDYVISNTSYDLNSADNQNICSVMINGVSVCQGYAKSVQLLLNRCGIEATLVTGNVDNEVTAGPHAWNLVKSNGSWYYMDATWGDASFRGENTVNEGIVYDYLLTTTTDIAYTHSMDSVVPMVTCDHMDDNYYVREGAYFSGIDLNKFKNLVDTRKRQSSDFVTFKCSSNEVYEGMLTELIDNSKIFDYISKLPGEKVSFSRSDKQRSVTIWF